VDGISFCATMGDFFSAVRGLFDPVDLPLLDLLLNFSPLPVITNSGWLCSSFLCLRLMKNQNAPSEASSRTATGTTIAGIRVLRFEFEECAAAELVAAREVVDVELCVAVASEDAASADVIDANCVGSLMVLVCTDVNVLSTPLTSVTNGLVRVTVVRGDASVADTIDPLRSEDATAVGAICEGSVAVGLPMRVGKVPPPPPCGSRLWKARPC
jgi:hypothetical protein